MLISSSTKPSPEDLPPMGSKSNMGAKSDDDMTLSDSKRSYVSTVSSCVSDLNYLPVYAICNKEHPAELAPVFAVLYRQAQQRLDIAAQAFRLIPTLCERFFMFVMPRCSLTFKSTFS